MAAGVYEIMNTVNGHKYIGSAVNIAHRWNCHKSDLNKNKHHSTYLQRAWNKYGEDCFEFSVLDYCDKEQLIEREQYFIDTLKPSYNVSPTAKNCIGVKHTPEFCEKISNNKIGNKYATKYMRSEEGRTYFSSIHKGKIVSSETRTKISLAGMGRIVSNETRIKMGLSHKGEKNCNSKLTWKQIEEIRTRYIPRIISQRKLAKEYGVDQQVIWAILNNKTWRIELNASV